MLASIRPLVSVILPTYNRPTFLKQALTSLSQQSLTDFEIIIINDGGSDVKHVLNQFSNLNIKYLSYTNRKGPASARNYGLQTAEGKYIAYLDDDDLYYPDHLKTLVEFLEVSRFKVAYTDAEMLIQKDIGGEYVILKKEVVYSQDFYERLLLIKNYIPVLCIMHEKACLEETGYFDENLPVQEDWDLWIRLSRIFQFGHIKKVTCAFTRRLDRSSLTFTKRNDFIITTETIYKKYDKYLKDDGIIRKIQQKYLKIAKGQIVTGSNVDVYEFNTYPLKRTTQKRKRDINFAVLINGRASFANYVYGVLKNLNDTYLGSRASLLDIHLDLENDPGAYAEFEKFIDYNIHEEYVIVITEPYVPKNKYFLAHIINVILANPQLSCVSCRVFPNEEEDIFDLWESELYGKIPPKDFFWYLPEEAKGPEWSLGSYDLKRVFTLFNPFCFSVRRDIIKNHPNIFKDMGYPFIISLLEEKHKIGYMFSTGVVSLNNRDHLRVLKENYIATILEDKYLNVLPSFPLTLRNVTVNDILSWTALLYSYFLDLRWDFRSIIERLNKCKVIVPSGKNNRSTHDDSFLNFLWKLMKRAHFSEIYKDNILVSLIIRDINALCKYMQLNSNTAYISWGMSNAIKKVVSKNLGILLASYFLEHSHLELITNDLLEIDKIIRKL